MNNLKDTKGTLARLLAGENLNIVYSSSAQTASFDPKSRTIQLPVWREMSADLYDLLHGHETGHAIDTPADGWHNELSENPGFKSILNICEDARIEKRQKRRYQGLSRPFARGYKELYDRGFFGVEKLQNLSKLNLADRINLYFKLGSLLIVPFDEKEREIVEQVAAAESWEDTVRIAKILRDYIKQEEQDKISNTKDLMDALYDETHSESGDEDESDVEYDSEFDSEPQAKEIGEQDDSADSEEDTTSETTGDMSDENLDQEPQSVTDKIFRFRENELLAQNCTVYVGDFPEAILENIVVSNNDQLALFDKYYAYAKESGIDVTCMKKTCMDKFNMNNLNYISMLLKEFEMRKNASQYARRQTSRSGDIDTSLLHKYKYSNDIFRKMTIVPKGKNHGLVLFLDMSGSMMNSFSLMIEQLMILGIFCKKANIPFDFYGFSDCIHTCKKKQFESDKFDIRSTGFGLVQLMSSSSSNAQFKKSLEMMSIVAYNNWGELFNVMRNNIQVILTHVPGFNFKLNETPFTETLFASRNIIENFKNNKKVDIVNVIYLTDGEGNHNVLNYVDAEKDNIRYLSVSGQLGSSTYSGKSSRFAFRFVLTDKKTKKQFILDSANIQKNHHFTIQTELTKFIRELTGCKHIAYYITDNFCRYMTSSEEEFVKCKKLFNQNNFVIVEKIGYDSYYFVKNQTKKINENLVIDKNMTKASIGKAFKNSFVNKSKNRMLISKFATDIAAA